MTAAVFAHEQLFARRHERLLRAGRRAPRPRRRAPGPFGPAPHPRRSRGERHERAARSRQRLRLPGFGPRRGWPPPRWFRVWMRGGHPRRRRPPAGPPWRSACSRPVPPATRRSRPPPPRPSSRTCCFIVLKRRVRRRAALRGGAAPALPRPKPPDPFSFPSGHSMNAFAVCHGAGAAVPARGPALALLAVSIAASRVVLGMHYVSDVWAGAALGTLMGAGAYAGSVDGGSHERRWRPGAFRLPPSRLPDRETEDDDRDTGPWPGWDADEDASPTTTTTTDRRRSTKT